MKIKARVNIMAASMQVWPTIGGWVGHRAMVLGSLITVSGRLIILGYSRTGICCACIFLSSILSSFVISLSPRARLDLTTMLSTGPLTRL